MEQDDRSRTPFIASVRARAVRGTQARAKAFRTLMAYQRPPRGVGTPRALRVSAIVLRVVEPDLRISAMIGRTLLAARSAPALTAETAAACAASMLGLPSLTPFAFAAARADLVLPAIKARSFSQRRPSCGRRLRASLPLPVSCPRFCDQPVNSSASSFRTQADVPGRLWTIYLEQLIDSCKFWTALDVPECQNGAQESSATNEQYQRRILKVGTTGRIET